MPSISREKSLGGLSECRVLTGEGHAVGELEEGVVHVVPSLPAAPEAAGAVEPGDGGLGDPPDAAQARAVRLSAPGDLRDDAALAQAAAVAVVVVAAVGIQRARLAPGAAPFAPHRWHAVDQRQELGDIVAVAAGQRYPQRGAVSVGQHVVLRARPSAVNRARTTWCGTSWTPPPATRGAQWNVDDPEGEDIRHASVGQLSLTYWVNRPLRRLSVLTVTWLG